MTTINLAESQNLPFACLPRLYFLLSAIVALHLSRVLYKFPLFVQNKPNLLDALMNVNKVLTRDYENKSNWKLGENKANTNPIKANTNPIPHQKTPQRILSPQGYKKSMRKFSSLFVGLLHNLVQLLRALLGLSRYSYSHAEPAQFASHLRLVRIKLKTAR